MAVNLLDVIWNQKGYNFVTGQIQRSIQIARADPDNWPFGILYKDE
jgi:hypothetical protein